MTTTVTKIKAQKNSDENTLAGSEQHARIAEQAYYKAEQRGFAPGHELEDWYETERECLV